MAFDAETYGAAVGAAKRYHDEHTGGQAVMVGTVTNGGSFPTVRPGGADLIIGDFVKPAKTSTLPFTISGITFNSYSDQAVYDGNGGWMYNANPYQKTSETPVANKSTESISGTANYQSQINAEVKDELDDKVDKLTTSDLRAYTHNGSSQGEVRISVNPLEAAIPRYDSPSKCIRTNTPLVDADCANKKYVDDRTKQYEFTFAGASTWSITHNLDKFPDIKTFDSSGNTIVGNVEHINKSTAQVTFSSAQSGKAIVN